VLNVASCVQEARNDRVQQCVVSWYRKEHRDYACPTKSYSCKGVEGEKLKALYNLNFVGK
jgi:hypothetical protein